MGCGKTSVGRRLAELLGWTFIDLDEEIEKRIGQTIREVFAQRGEAHFRAIEREELSRVSRFEKAVIALGGGAFCSAENRKITESTGVSIWLDVRMEVLFPRCVGNPARPLFTTRDGM